MSFAAYRPDQTARDSGPRDEGFQSLHRPMRDDLRNTEAQISLESASGPSRDRFARSDGEAAVKPDEEPVDSNAMHRLKLILDQAPDFKLSLYPEYMESTRPPTSIPFPRSCVAIAPDNEILIDIRLDTERRTITAGLAPIVSRPDPSTCILRIDAFNARHTSLLHENVPRNPDGSPLTVLPRETTISARHSAAPAGLAPDIFIRSAIQRENARLQERGYRLLPPLVWNEAQISKLALRQVLEVKAEVEACIRALEPYGIEETDPCTPSLSQKIYFLFEKLLELTPTAPTAVRSIMFYFDTHVMPGLKACGHPLAYSFGSSDELLVLPLLRFHSDAQALITKTTGLTLSPLASLEYFAADAIHMRYFASYDAEDIVKVPGLLRCFLPYMEALIGRCRTFGESSAEATSARLELKRYLRGLLNGLVLLSDFGAFKNVIAPPTRHVMHKSTKLDSASLERIGYTEAGFKEELSRLGQRIIGIAKSIHQIMPGELSQTIPAWYEYFHGYYGSDEVESIHRYNAKLQPADRISLLDVLTGSDSKFAQEYCLLHRGVKPRGMQNRKRSQFSAEARRHVLHGRAIWRTFCAHVTETLPANNNLAAVRSGRSLAVAHEVFATATRVYPSHRLLFHRVCELLSRVAPPRDSSEALRSYYVEGLALHAKVHAFALELSATNAPAGVQQAILLANRRFAQYLGKVAGWIPMTVESANRFQRK